MKRVALGSTGRDVSALALGCLQFCRATEESSRAVVIRAFELGVDFFDTADVYGWRDGIPGQSEEVLGAALREAGIPRDQVVVASKCGIVQVGMEKAYSYKAYDLSSAYVKTSCEMSLQRLGMEYLDLYQLHRIDYLAHPEETARALEDLQAEGKIRHAGVSNHTPDEIRALAAYTRLESQQTEFSLLHLEPLETGLTSVCLERQMALLCWAPLHRGTLASGGPLSHADWQQQREQGAIAQMQAFAKAYGITLGQLALAWLMQLPGGVVPLVGTINPQHLTEAAGAAEVQLDRDDWYELMTIARGRPMPWGQRPFAYLKER